MFTGLVQAVGQLLAIESRGGDVRMRVHAGAEFMAGIGLGDSICICGVCLTALEIGTEDFVVDVSNETLACTTLGDWSAGNALNLERSLTLSTPLGGHFVSGHVDGVGQLSHVREDARSQRWEIRSPPALLRYIAVKGSICVEGVSLTVNSVDAQGFGVNLIPHTLAHTNLGSLGPGARVNLEVDLIARYVERLLVART